MQCEIDSNVLNVLWWINICAGIPLTVLFICCLWCLAGKDHIPIIYVTNLLISNLIQMWSMILFTTTNILFSFVSLVAFYYGVTASLGFRVCVSLERYMVITLPKQHCIRDTISSVMVCVAVWVLCFIIPYIAVHLTRYFFLSYLALIPLPLFIACLALTLKALPTATSVTVEEKRRTVGVLVLLLLNYCFLLLPVIISFITSLSVFDCPTIYLSLIECSLFVDFILCVFMRRGPIDRLLVHLCCCRMDNTAVDDSGTTSV